MPWSIADLDDDGRLDIAGQTLVDGQTSTGWWANNVDGTFGPFQSFNAPYSSVDGVGQFGGGSATDALLRVQQGSTFSWVVVLDPGLPGSSLVATDLDPGGGTRSIADVDFDGDDDVLYLQFGNPAQFTLRHSNGDGSFGSPVAVAAYVAESEIVLAHVDGTGRHDIVFFNAFNGMTVIGPEGIELPSEVVSVDVRLVGGAAVGNFAGTGTDDVVRFSFGAEVVPDAYKTFRFQGPGSDDDGDGVDNAIDVGDGWFDDGSTTGSIVSVLPGLVVQVSDAANLADGVRVVVTGTSDPADRVALSVCGGFTVRLATGSDAVLTSGSVTVSNKPGMPPVEIVLLNPRPDW